MRVVIGECEACGTWTYDPDCPGYSRARPMWCPDCSAARNIPGWQCRYLPKALEVDESAWRWAMRQCEGAHPPPDLRPILEPLLDS